MLALAVLDTIDRKSCVHLIVNIRQTLCDRQGDFSHEITALGRRSGKSMEG